MLSLRSMLLASMVICLASCYRSADQPVTYFDSLILAQTRYLSARNASVEKKSAMNGGTDQSTFTPDSVLWVHELDIFRQLSISQRAAYRAMYRVEDGLKDNRSNLLIRQYQTDQHIPVRELKFYYFQHFNNLKKIEAVYQQENLLYSTTQRLTLEFDDVNGTAVLNHYGVEGSQKMLLSDTISFSVQSHIID